MSLIEKLNWRYATKQMDASKVVPQEKIDTIIEAIRLSASSMGLQPYNLLVIQDKETLAKIQPVAYNQPQITAATALVIFAAWDVATPERINKHIQLVASERGVSEESLAGFKGMIEGAVAKLDEASAFNWMARQAYIALGTGLAAAAVEGVDATPMEGFNNAALDELLNLSAKGLKSVLLMPLGYRDEAKDYLAKAKKVRKPVDELVVAL